MSKKKKSKASIAATRNVESGGPQKSFEEIMTVKNCDEPTPFNYFLESLAGVLIEIAEKNGTLSTPKRRSTSSKAA